MDVNPSRETLIILKGYLEENNKKLILCICNYLSAHHDSILRKLCNIMLLLLDLVTWNNDFVSKVPIEESHPKIFKDYMSSCKSQQSSSHSYGDRLHLPKRG